MAEVGHPGVTLCGWQEVQIWLLARSKLIKGSEECLFIRTQTLFRDRVIPFVKLENNTLSLNNS